MFKIIYNGSVYTVIDITNEHYKCLDGEGFLFAPKENSEVA